jgi:flagellar biosynthesis protein FlhB
LTHLTAWTDVVLARIKALAQLTVIGVVLESPLTLDVTGRQRTHLVMVMMMMMMMVMMMRMMMRMVVVVVVMVMVMMMMFDALTCCFSCRNARSDETLDGSWNTDFTILTDVVLAWIKAAAHWTSVDVIVEAKLTEHSANHWTARHCTCGQRCCKTVGFIRAISAVCMAVTDLGRFCTTRTIFAHEPIREQIPTVVSYHTVRFI